MLDPVPVERPGLSFFRSGRFAEWTPPELKRPLALMQRKAEKSRQADLATAEEPQISERSGQMTGMG